MLALVLLACQGEPASSAPAAPPTPVKVQPVSPAPLEERVEAVGSVEAQDTMTVRAEVSGRVVKLGMKPGDRVSRGQLLIQLADAEARAALADAEARLGLARAAAERAEALKGDLSAAELEQAQAALASADAAVDRAREQVRKTQVIAPFSGVVGDVAAVEGELLDPSRVVTRLDSEALQVDLRIPETDAARLAVGQRATVTVDALPGRSLEGSVRFVEPRVDTASRTVLVQVEVAGEGLRPGQSARVSVVVEQRAEAVLVPAEAVVPTAKGAAVYLVGPEGTVVLTPVKTGLRLPDRVEITEGLAPGDALVVEGLARLRPGAKVEVVP